VVTVALAFYYDAVEGTAPMLVTPVLVFAARKQLSGLNRIADGYHASINARRTGLSETVSGMEPSRRSQLANKREDHA
jgi:hypothetical protein